MKRFAAAMLALVLSLSLGTMALAASPFGDVPETHWAYEYVDTAVRKGWSTGVTATEFQPEGKVTGAQFITMVVRAFYPGDIPAGVASPWYQPYVTAGDAHGLRATAGLATAEDLNAGLSRYQMAAIMGDLLKAAGIRGPGGFDPAAAIPDWGQIPAQYRESVALTYSLNLLTGMNAAGTFGGAGQMTRAQAAAVMCRLDRLVPVQSPGTDPITPADMVSNPALLQRANQRIGAQYSFLYGLRAGAVFQQDWTVAMETMSPEGWLVQWFRVIEPGVASLADIQRVWETYFSRTWAIPPEYLENYMEFGGKLYTCNPGIGGDIAFREIRAEEVLSREGGRATLRAEAYYNNEFSGIAYTREYRCEMIWEDGQWKCCGLYPAEN